MAESISLLSPHPFQTPTHNSSPILQTHTTTIINQTLTSLDPYTLLKLNQTATPQENHTEWLKLVEMAADHALLRSQTSANKKSLLFCWFCVPVILTGAHGANF